MILLLEVMRNPPPQTTVCNCFFTYPWNCSCKIWMGCNSIFQLCQSSWATPTTNRIIACTNVTPILKIWLCLENVVSYHISQYLIYQALFTGAKGIALFLLHSIFWHKTLTLSSCEPQTASCNLLPCLLKYFCSFSLVRYWCKNIDKFGHKAHEESQTTNRTVHLLPSPRNLHLFRNRTMLPFCNDDEHDGI